MQSGFDWAILAPELTLAGFALLALLMEGLFWPRRSAVNLGYLSLLGCLVALSLALVEWTEERNAQELNGMLLADPYSTFFDILLLCSAVFALLLALQHLPHSDRDRGEYYPLFLLATLGMMATVAAGDLVLLFVGLELTSLCLYVLVGTEWRLRSANEVSLKQLISGMLGTGLLIYGIGLIYGETGSTGLRDLEIYLREIDAHEWGLLLPGLGLVLAGLAVKIGIAPFHMWAPDVYQGTQAPVTAFLLLGPKLVGGAVLGRLLLYALVSLEDVWMPVLWGLSAASMIGGYLLALNQRNLKRVLAYAGVSQSGFALLGLVAANESGLTGMLFHLVACALANVGVIAALVTCHRGEEEGAELGDYRGLGSRHPWLALGLALSMIGLAGLPPTAGFMGRVLLLSAALEAGYLGLALLGSLGCLLGIYVHLRVVVGMYMQSADAERTISVIVAPEALVVLLLAVVGTIGLGLWPSSLLDVVRAALMAIM
jgi:NADH-quinone oxidoreductase subunit N